MTMWQFMSENPWLTFVLVFLVCAMVESVVSSIFRNR